MLGKKHWKAVVWGGEPFLLPLVLLRMDQCQGIVYWHGLIGFLPSAYESHWDRTNTRRLCTGSDAAWWPSLEQSL